MTTVMKTGATLLVWAATAHAAPLQAATGDVYEVRVEYRTSSEGTNGSSSSSSGSDALIERVVEMTPNGLILEYDLPSEPTLPHGRQDQWQYPARVLKPLVGPMQLLNVAELEARIEQWLEHTETPRSACGTWYFTWNAFEVECDPQSVVATLERYDLRPGEVRNGTMFEHPMALAPGPLTAGADGTSFAAEMAIDPDTVRQERAESDVVAAQIMREPVTLDDALRARAAEKVSGTITVTFNIDAAGGVRRKTEVTELETRQSDGTVETSTATVTVERRLISQPNA